MAWPSICFIIRGDMIYSVLAYGFLRRSSSEGGSVASAKAARVSMIRLIQSIYTGEKIASWSTAAATKVVMTATTLTVS